MLYWLGLGGQQWTDVGTLVGGVVLVGLWWPTGGAVLMAIMNVTKIIE